MFGVILPRITKLPYKLSTVTFKEKHEMREDIYNVATERYFVADFSFGRHCQMN